MNNIAQKTEYACSGCGACAAVCPKDAVKLRLDEAGFYTAQVDEASCVDCGLCRKVCTRFDAEIGGVNLRDAELFALQSADAATVQHCSSGGIAHLLAQQALTEGWKAVGVAYNAETNRAEHIVVDSDEQLSLLDGSKYLQSDPGVFRSVLAEAKADPAAKFAAFGTPCQITGLAKAAELLGLREQFLLTEIFCHGVPSYRLWEAECAEIQKKLHAGKFDSVQFRYKKNDWHSYCLRVDADGKTFYGARETELFWQVFFENVLLGDACMNCRMRKEASRADLRLGDYWGARFRQRSDGVSAVFALTERGKNAVERLRSLNLLTAFDAGTAEEMLKAQNMEEYHQQKLHDDAMTVLRSGGDVKAAVRTYRAGQSARQKLKRIALRASAVLPDDLRAKLRKANSARKTR